MQLCQAILRLLLTLPIFPGEGNYGVVFKGRNKKTGVIGAIKIMDAVLDKEEDIRAELSVLEQFSHHSNIVDFYGSYLKKQELADDQLWIAMEVQLAVVETTMCDCTVQPTTLPYCCSSVWEAQ